MRGGRRGAATCCRQLLQVGGAQLPSWQAPHTPARARLLKGGPILGRLCPAVLHQGHVLVIARKGASGEL